MKLLTVLRIVVSMLPMIIQAIKAVEEAIPGKGEGELKLALVRGLLETAYSVATDVEVSFEEVWPVLLKTITAIVGAFNKSGTFGRN